MEKEKKSILPLLIIGGALLLGAKKAEAKVAEKKELLPREEKVAVEAFEKEREAWRVPTIQIRARGLPVPEWARETAEKLREIIERVIEVPPPAEKIEKGIERAEEKVKKVLPPEERVAIGALEHERKLREVIEEIAKKLPKPPMMPQPAPPAPIPTPELVKGLESVVKVIYL